MKRDSIRLDVRKGVQVRDGTGEGLRSLSWFYPDRMVVVLDRRHGPWASAFGMCETTLRVELKQAGLYGHPGSAEVLGGMCVSHTTLRSLFERAGMDNEIDQVS